MFVLSEDASIFHPRNFFSTIFLLLGHAICLDWSSLYMGSGKSLGWVNWVIWGYSYDFITATVQLIWMWQREKIQLITIYLEMVISWIFSLLPTRKLPLFITGRICAVQVSKRVELWEMMLLRAVKINLHWKGINIVFLKKE